MSKYDGMTDREIDTLIAERVMGRTVEGRREVQSETYAERYGYGSASRIWQQLPRYSDDYLAAKRMRERLEELSLERDVIQHLESYLGLVRADNWDIAIWIYSQAAPRAWCIAALMALDLQTLDK